MTIKDKIKVGTLTLENRFVMPPMATWKQSEDGSIPNALVQYYADRAGKIGLIVMEFAYVSEEGKTRPGQLSIARDADISELKKIADAVHAKSTTKIFAQINHAGAAAGYEVKGQEDIERIIKAFADAAIRAQKAGFDGVEIHAAHGYLLNQFYSPLVNHRDDCYSAASMESRTRLTVEVIQAVRKAVGKDYPLSLRFGACDYAEGGSKVKEVGEAARIYENAGVDMLSISGGMNGFMIKGVSTPGWFSELSWEAKKAVKIPVLLTGGITTKKVAEELLANGKADLIGVGRPLLKDPTEAISNFL